MDTPTLTITNAQGIDTAYYDVVITNSCGSITSQQAGLAVQCNVAITAQPGSAHAYRNERVSFTVAGVGDGSVTYRWRKDGEMILSHPRMTGMFTDTLTINPATFDDVAVYDVVVGDDCGGLISAPATLTLDSCESPDFNCDGDIGTDADIEAFFMCLAGACTPPPCFNDADVDGDGDFGTDADIEAYFRILAGGAC